MRNIIMGVMRVMGMMGAMSKRTEGQQHCCWESLRDYSLVKLKLQSSQTELLFRSVADSFLPCGLWGVAVCFLPCGLWGWLTAFFDLRTGKTNRPVGEIQPGGLFDFEG